MIRTRELPFWGEIKEARVSSGEFVLSSKIHKTPTTCLETDTGSRKTVFIKDAGISTEGFENFQHVKTAVN